jgi:hypothetical protein
VRIAFVSNLTNGVGLERDFRILRTLAESMGHAVTGFNFRTDRPTGAFDLCIFGEVFDRRFLTLAKRNWMIPNPEWWFDRWTPYLPRFERVLCKTRDAERIFAGRGAKTRFVGFKAEDRLDSSIPRERRFLHVAGESLLKGTAAIIDAWERYAIPYHLTVVANKMDVRAVPNVTVVKRVDDAELRRLQNGCLFHLQPSEYEGFGHVLHESMSVGAILATTDAPPMNEVQGLHIPPAARGKHGLAQTAQVDAAGVAAAVESMWGMDDAAVIAARALARKAYEAETAAFEAAFREQLK